MRLRKTARNFLDMMPVRNVEEFTRESDRITLLIPKFKSKWMSEWFIPRRRSQNFRIHLDETGSKVWDLIDGKRNTGEICEILAASGMPSANQVSTPELRVTEFLRQLYRNRFILFK